MLNVLRESFKSQPYLKVVLAVTGIGLVFYLGSYFACDGTAMSPSDWAAQVNGAEISARELRDRARLIDENYRRMFGQNYDQIRQSLRLGTEAMDSLIEEQVILDDARRMGLEATREEVGKEIVENTSFHDASGRFIGKERYQELLDARYPGGHLAFERGLAQDLLIDKWRNLVGQPVTVSDAELEEEFRRRNVKTEIDWILVPHTPAPDDLSDAELRAWHASHAEDYRRPEGRKVRYVVVDREAEAAKIGVTEAELRARYLENEETYRHPEERQARHILFRSPPDATPEQLAATRAKAEAALARLRGGADFAELARELSEDEGSGERGGDLGFFPRGSMVAPFEEAAFGTPVGQLAPVTETPFGFHVIEVTDARDAGAIPFEEVRDSIRQALTVDRAQELTTERAGAIREEVAAGASLEEVAAREGLTVGQAVVTEDARLPELGPSTEFLQAVATLAPAAVSEPLRVARGLAVVVADEITPSAVASLDEVRDRVRHDLAAARAREAATRKARVALSAERDLEGAARSLGLEVGSSGKLSPGQSIPGAGTLPPDVQERLFREGVTAGETGVADLTTGALVYEVTSHDPWTSERFEQERQALSQEVLAGKRSRYVRDVIDRLRERQSIEVNRPLVAQFDGGA